MRRESRATGKIAAAAGCLLAGGLAVLVATAGPARAQDPDAGERIFRRACAACHSFDPQRRMPGPHLLGIFGRRAGSVEGARYSRALSRADIVWDEANLTAYITSPRTFLPGTTMVERLRNPDDVPVILDYLRRHAAPAP